MVHLLCNCLGLGLLTYQQCLSYRWGAVGSEYDWDSDDDDDDGEFEQAVQDHLASLPAGKASCRTWLPGLVH